MKQIRTRAHSNGSAIADQSANTNVCPESLVPRHEPRGDNNINGTIEDIKAIRRLAGWSTSLLR